MQQKELGGWRESRSNPPYIYLCDLECLRYSGRKTLSPLSAYCHQTPCSSISLSGSLPHTHTHKHMHARTHTIFYRTTPTHSLGHSLIDDDTFRHVIIHSTMLESSYSPNPTPARSGTPIMNSFIPYYNCNSIIGYLLLGIFPARIKTPQK